MSPTKRTLGLEYLTATGIVLTLIVVVNGVVAFESSPVRALGILSGAIPSVSLVSARFLLERSRLDDNQIWSIATWGGLGIGVLTLLNTAIIFLHRIGDPAVGLGVTILASNVAVGGVVGILIGGFWEHSEENRRLNEKNAVLSRVLRHDLRNAAGIIGAQAEILEDDLPPADCRRLEVIKHKTEEIAELGDLARTLQSALDPSQHGARAIDVTEVIEDRCQLMADANPHATLETDLPDDAWAEAGTLFETVVDNLLQNAVHHNDNPHPSIHVSVETGSRWVTVEVEDDGPGIPDREVIALESEEDPLDHSSGTGLWLVKWLVERYGGDLSIDRTGTGTVVRIRLRRASTTKGKRSLAITSIYS